MNPNKLPHTRHAAWRNELIEHLLMRITQEEKDEMRRNFFPR